MALKQIDGNGRVVREWENVGEAGRTLGIPETNIYKVLSGKRSIAGGFFWKKDESPVEITENNGTSFFEDLENGTLKVDVYYDHPPHPDEVIKDHRIDTEKWRLSNFYSKGRGKGWLVTAQFLNLQAQQGYVDLTEDRIENVFERYKDYNISLNNYAPDKVDSIRALRVIITDVHIGMDIENGLYGGKWNAVELEKRRRAVVEDIQEHGRLYGGFEEIHFVDLGDLADGLGATTTRGSHTLPQNMADEDAFDVAVDFKTRLVLDVAGTVKCEAIRVFNICNDNHSGSFGYFINASSGRILELSGGKVKEVRNIRAFMDHYIYGKHAFILCHGKDKDHMRNGLNKVLDTTAKDKIDNYIAFHKLTQQAEHITFEKGDTHVQVFDHSNSEHYEYNTYRALSPSSAWVQTNFKRGTSGFTLQVVDRDRNKKTTTPVQFDWQ